MRVLLNGLGDPIPQFALPDPTQDPNFPPISLLLPDGQPFLKAPYVTQGYTNFEVWCIGACGGLGGSILSPFSAYNYYSYGGAGGGGGLQRVFGLLADLPASAPVVVGKVGANGANGNGEPPLVARRDPSNPPNFVQPIVWDPNPNHTSPTDGQDGGASSFNGVTCRASGGKAGKKSLAENWDSAINTGPPPTNSPSGPRWRKNGPGGDGGDGGRGGSVVAGGGGSAGWTEVIGAPTDLQPNANFTFHPAQDGVWDGAIGSGGGGGSSGTGSFLNTFPPQTTVVPSKDGAQGSWSYDDTSVYGAKQQAQTIVVGASPMLILGGGGGGAKLNPQSGYGSRATGFTLDGVVWIRVTKI